MADTGLRIGPIAGTGADALLYTCAVAAGAWIRFIVVANTTTTPQVFRLCIGATVVVGTAIHWDTGVDPPPQPPLEEGVAHFVANTQTIRWNAPTTLTITMSGIEST